MPIFCKGIMNDNPNGRLSHLKLAYLNKSGILFTGWVDPSRHPSMHVTRLWALRLTAPYQGGSTEETPMNALHIPVLKIRRQINEPEAAEGKKCMSQSINSNYHL
jgi:hypothetical protein